MSKIVVREAHSLPIAEAKNRVGAFDDFIQKYGAKLDWKSDTAAVIKGMGISGDVSIGADSVTVMIKLGMMARAAGVDPVKLEGSVRKRLAKAIAGEDL
jgi:putative polyhydroxyalkanoate system protein